MAEERKPVFKPTATPTQIQIAQVGTNCLSNDKGHYWIYEVTVNGMPHIWFVNPRMKTALGLMQAQVGAILNVVQTAHINPNTNKSYSGCSITNTASGQVEESTECEPTANPNAAAQPATNGNGQSTNGNGQARAQVAPSSVTLEGLTGLYKLCLQASMRAFIDDDIQKGLELLRQKGIQDVVVKDVATHFSIAMQDAGIYAPPVQAPATTSQPANTQPATQPELNPPATAVPAGNGADPNDQDDLPF